MTDLVAQLVVALERLSGQCERMRLPGQPMSDAEKNAIAALTAAKAGGWVAVPVEPTDEMLAAGKKQAHSNNSVGAKCLRIYAAMLAARPLPTPPAQRGEG